jgi:hypothetical protein
MTKRLDYRAIGGKGLIIPTPLYVDDGAPADHDQGIAQEPVRASPSDRAR